MEGLKKLRSAGQAVMMTNHAKKMAPSPPRAPPPTEPVRLRLHPELARKPVCMVVLDGYGEGAFDDRFNACHSASTPTIDAMRAFPGRWARVAAAGRPLGQTSADDVGHEDVGLSSMSTGATSASRAALVDASIRSGELYRSEGWECARESFANHTVHFIALLGSGGVHSRQHHLQALLSRAAADGATRIRVHVILDGIDVPDNSASRHLECLEKELAALAAAHGCDAKLASGGGRNTTTFANPWDSDWEPVRRGWRTHVLGDSPNIFQSGADALRELKAGGGRPEETAEERSTNAFFGGGARPMGGGKRSAAGKDGGAAEGGPAVSVCDADVPDFVIVDGLRNPVGAMKDGDAVVVANFRGDAVLGLCQAFADEGLGAFDKATGAFDKGRVPVVTLVGLMRYDQAASLPTRFLVPTPPPVPTLAEHLAASGLRSLVCAETANFGHAGYFGQGESTAVPGAEARLCTTVHVPSRKGAPLDDPAMKAPELAEVAAAGLRCGQFDLVRVHLAVPGAVASTGDVRATAAACEAADAAVRTLVQCVDEVGGVLLLTSVRGSAEEMVFRVPSKKWKGEPEIDPETSRPLLRRGGTAAPVPLAISGHALPPNVYLAPPSDGSQPSLTNVAATVINLMGLEAPVGLAPSLLRVDPLPAAAPAAVHSWSGSARKLTEIRRVASRASA